MAQGRNCYICAAWHIQNICHTMDMLDMKPSGNE